MKVKLVSLEAKNPSYGPFADIVEVYFYTNGEFKAIDKEAHIYWFRLPDNQLYVMNIKEDKIPITSEAKFLHCHSCGKVVSTALFPVPTDTPDKGLIVRAYIQCPECMEKEIPITKSDLERADRATYDPDKKI